MTHLKLDKILVVDVEATCWDPPLQSKSIEFQSEIIEIGICTLDAASGQIEDKTSIIVKPKHSKVSTFCTQLTTLTPEQVGWGISLSEAFHELQNEFDSMNRVWASYGDYDRVQFQKESKLKALSYPFSPRHINIKNLFAILYGLPKEIDMPMALAKLGLTLDGTHHRGHDDAWNIARIAQVVLARRQLPVMPLAS